MRRLFISFSGGETSGEMAARLTSQWRHRWDQIVVGFANTAEENEETLRFVDRCDRHFGLGVVWIEADVQHGERTRTGHRVVTFETASRKGQPFEEVIRKYGIPNQDWPHCTRELKLNPMYSYLDAIGWERGTYDIAIGMRADETARLSATAKDAGIFYPLADPAWHPMTKPDVNLAWMARPFRLELTGYQGNCRTCWKKSLIKLLTIMDESPEKFDFFDRMEETYGRVGAEFSKPETPPTFHRVFFRESRSAKDLRKLHKELAGNFERAPDDALEVPANRSIFDSCQETCEPNFEEQPA